MDSTPLRVCKHQRILIHKTFKVLAERRNCYMGWFFEFKLHLIINDRGDILNFMFIPGNIDDSETLYSEFFYQEGKGQTLWRQGILVPKRHTAGH